MLCKHANMATLGEWLLSHESMHLPLLVVGLGEAGFTSQRP
ncbi:hypothetical protein VP96_03799 [Vibrio cholerae]|nr:hypothetical protein VP96_03799 [Vibrio cholerae]CSD30758.1 Uncharacterised protein [Vibrio cholerae]CSD80070.1 Uncharacterised protein [Vibrio cholerae]